MIILIFLFFFFKQKTAYEMRISDWSSAVCSSDLAMCDPERFSALAPTEQQPPVSVATTLDGLIAERMAHLRAYQDARLAARFEHLVHQVQAAEERVAPGATTLAMAAARSYSRLLAYKDEYEVARLLTDSGLKKIGRAHV